MHLRFITPEDDRTALSRIYEASWKHFYKGIVPSSFLDSIPEGFWASKIGEPGRILFLPFVVNRETKNLWGFAVSENSGLPIFRIGMKSIPYTFFPDIQGRDSGRLFRALPLPN